MDDEGKGKYQGQDSGEGANPQVAPALQHQPQQQPGEKKRKRQRQQGPPLSTSVGSDVPHTQPQPAKQPFYQQHAQFLPDPPQQHWGPPIQQFRQGQPSWQPMIPQQEQPQPQEQETSVEGDHLKQMVVVKPGTKGRKIVVESNHLALNVGDLKEAVHYDVSITPDAPKGLLRDVMNVFRQKHYPNRHPAYDGRKNLYSPTKLPFGPTDSISDTIMVEGKNGPTEFKVEIKIVRMVDLAPLNYMLKSSSGSLIDALKCLSIVLGNASNAVNRYIFTTQLNQIIQLGDGMEMYHRFQQSAIRGWNPLPYVDAARKVSPTASHLLDLICELGSMTRENLNQPLSDQLTSTLDKFLTNLKIVYEITGQRKSMRIRKVNGLKEPATKAQFKRNGKMMTVQEYFQKIKGCSLKYPHLPTVWVGGKDRQPRVLLPLEFCTLVQGQAVNRKMGNRKGKIMTYSERAKYNNDPCVREFGFSVKNQFESLEARVLQPPELEYAENSLVRPEKGVWRMERNQFLKGAEIKKWTVASVTRYPCKMEMLAGEIYRNAGARGIRMTGPAIPPFQQVGGGQTLRDITDYFKTKQDFDLIFVVVPNSGPQYFFVKQAAELNVGCVTQCIKEKTLKSKLILQSITNILLKVNAKMNGINHTISVNSRPPIMNHPCMIMGADLIHPNSDAKDTPSIVAVAASYDPRAFQYNICWRLQSPQVDIIEDLSNITVEQLKFFYRKNNCKPEAIIFFRNGISEGQFEEVQKAEIMAIRNACKKVQPEDYEPKITFLAVQKNHQTRLFTTNGRDSEYSTYFSAPAGTCVDSRITNPAMQDFYLVSHASIHGVAKPTKYCTLWDDNKMNNDDIEELTYHLCHMSTRCTRSVSYPAPTYYAHLAASRAKVYFENNKADMDHLEKVQDDYKIKDSIKNENPMFFV